MMSQQQVSTFVNVLRFVKPEKINEILKSLLSSINHVEVDFVHELNIFTYTSFVYRSQPPSKKLPKCLTMTLNNVLILPRCLQHAIALYLCFDRCSQQFRKKCLSAAC